MHAFMTRPVSSPKAASTMALGGVCPIHRFASPLKHPHLLHHVFCLDHSTQRHPQVRRGPRALHACTRHLSKHALHECVRTPATRRAGVVGASVSEISFTWIGFAAAMGSNLSLCFRNVLSKRFMTPDIKELLGGAIGLFSMITMMSFLMLAPIAVAVEGVQLTPAALRAAGVDPAAIFKLLASSALCFHLYQQVSYMILSRVSPVSHSIGNCLKVLPLLSPPSTSAHSLPMAHPAGALCLHLLPSVIRSCIVPARGASGSVGWHRHPAGTSEGARRAAGPLCEEVWGCEGICRRSGAWSARG